MRVDTSRLFVYTALISYADFRKTFLIQKKKKRRNKTKIRKYININKDKNRKLQR